MNQVGAAETALLQAAIALLAVDYDTQPAPDLAAAASDRLALSARALVFAIDGAPRRPSGWEAHQCQQASAALALLRELVTLRDGPRDEAYREAKDRVWAEARELLRNGGVA